MIYLLKKNLREWKELRKELAVIKGFGKITACQICDRLGLNPKLLVKDLRFSQKKLLLEMATKNHVYGFKLKKLVLRDITRLAISCCYRGIRHTRRLAVRGQNTHSNAKTVKRLSSFTLVKIKNPKNKYSIETKTKKRAKKKGEKF